MEAIYVQDLKSRHDIETAKSISSYPRYCYLNEYLIQNGKIAFQCANDFIGSKAEYLIAMEAQNFQILNVTTGMYEKSMSPAVIHANYCGDKLLEFERLGLLLIRRNNNTFPRIRLEKGFMSHRYGKPMSKLRSYNHFNSSQSICEKYLFKNTNFGTRNWTQEIQSAGNELLELKKQVFRNGTIQKVYDKDQGERIFNFVEILGLN